MPTIVDIAKRANVSVMTVSRVLNNPEIVSDKTIKKIHKIMDNLGYQPSQIARSLVKKRTNTIGVIMPDIKNTFFNNLFRHIEDYASSHDFNLLLCNTDEEPEKEMKYIKLLQSQRVDGILIIPCSSSSIKYLIKSGIKFISVDRVHHNFNTDFIATDHYLGAYEATEHLIKLGHTKIAVLKGSGVLFPDIERFRGFLNAMKRYKFPVAKDLILNCEFDEALAYNAVKELHSRKEKPTAIFAFNSLMMIGAIKTLQALNKKIPGDVSLICFDEIPGYDIFEPKITCITQPVEELGNLAIKHLIDKIKHPKNSRKKILLKPRLIVGQSCKQIKENNKWN
jgi:LacI family transcriptional regulator